jgi:hypothetical protein
VTEFLLKLVGVSGEFLEHIDQATLAFQRPRLLWVGLALLAPVGYYIYRRQDRNLTAVPRALRALLSATRILILLILVLVLSGPFLKVDKKVERRPLVAVLLDDSRSMRLPAGPFDSDEELVKAARAAGLAVTDDGQVSAELRKTLSEMSRGALARSAVTTAADSLTAPLAEKYDVRYYTFADGLTPLALDGARPQLPEPGEKDGGSTRLGDALGAVLDEAAGRPVAGIVLFSDGQHTGGRAPLDAAQAAAKAAAPIFAVAPGSSRRPQDLSVIDVFTSGQVAVGDTARVSVTIESQGLDGQAAEVQLLDGEQVIASKPLTLRGAEHQQIELSFEADKPGTRNLKVNIPPLPEETEELQSNNSDVAVVRVNEDKLKVLFVDGRPRWDFRFLKNSLRRDQGLAGRTGDDPEIVLETEALRQNGGGGLGLPGTVEELTEYGVVIIGDASPKLLDAAFIQILGEAVRDHGLGLIVAAGPAYMPHAYGETLQDLLPVEMHASAAGMLAPTHTPFQLEVSPEGMSHEVMRLYEDAGRNQTVWSVMPPYYWCAAAERPAAAATVLAWNPNLEVRYGRVPLIAYHFAGEGKVMFVGLDSTWHWRQNVGERFFYKFWGQAIRFMASGAEDDDASEGPKRNRLEVTPVRIEPGETVQIELLAIDENGAPRTDPKMPVVLKGPEEETTVELLADGAVKGRFTGSLSPEVQGDFSLVWKPGADGEALETHFEVLEAPEELRHPGIDRLGLQQLAATSGGEMVALSDLAAIPDKLKGETKMTQLHREAAIWDNWLTLVALIFLYSLDVGLRRLKGLA